MLNGDFRLIFTASLLFSSLFFVSGLQSQGSNMEPSPIEVTSQAFQDGQPIPKRFSGEGEDLSPALSWSNIPPAAKELALITSDPDAPRPRPFIHWVLYGLDPKTTSLPEAVEPVKKPSALAGAMQGFNSAGKIGYMGPMPPPGHGTHHYNFTVYALDSKLNLLPGASSDDLEKAMKGHVLAIGKIVGTYKR